MRCSRRCLWPLSRRRWRLTLCVVTISFSALSWFLYVLIVLVVSSHDYLSTDLYQSEVREDILNLNSVEDVEFQGEESLPPLPDAFNDTLNFHETLLDVPPTYRKKHGKKVDPTLLRSTHVFKYSNRSAKYLFVLGHYEQLGKTTINFFHVGKLAAQLNRQLVIPFVRNSRFCGLQSGWTGPKRKKSREFLPMENFFDLKSMEELFVSQNFSSLAPYSDFVDVCGGKRRHSAILYFMYAGNKEESKRYMLLTESEHARIQSRMKENNGWTSCLSVAERLGTQERMSHLSFSTAFCVDPETISSVEELHGLVGDVKCVTIFLWRGVGFQRTHFNVSLPSSHDFYLSQIVFGKFIHDEAGKFLSDHFQGEAFISVQIRSERQLSWYGLNKFKTCLDLVKNVLNILVRKKNIKHIFFASDLEQHGSDQLSAIIEADDLSKAKKLFRELVSSLKGVVFKPDKSRGLIFNDSGFVALTQVQIVSRSKHLVTLGAGTFQSWMAANFKSYQKLLKRSWSLTRVCSVESKKRPKPLNSTL